MGLDRPYDLDYVPRGEALRFLSPGVRLSIADAFWLDTVQYVGDPRGRQRGFEKLYPLVDLVTDLDPGHGYAYQTAGIVLSAQGRLDEADRILNKGMGSGRPNWWTYPFYVAFNHYFYRGDYAEAARWARIAARTPGASPNIAHLALALEVKSGSPDDAVAFLQELRGVAKDEKTAEALDEQYRLALLQRDFARLDAAVAAYRERTGRAPDRLEELVVTGILDQLPPEPYGGRYTIDAEGVVHSSKNDFRFAPAEPGRLQQPARPYVWRPYSPELP
ncbi:tetratricopeptide repeat protein [Anaeromyxobacter oryzisoli]|uniref:tetratricopeptide repeat protein n=1 Tax=Anaeromyxobacter oryzisoli TaxID=2925408 RepID=UPI001F55CA4E|nr:tetratricopeptide repeat protein [Anaeromyxobacter sp. SG63]